MSRLLRVSGCFRKLAQALAIIAGTGILSACSMNAKIFDGLSSKTPPTLTFSSLVTGPSNVSTWNVQLSSSEPLSQLSSSDLVVTNGSITAFNQVDTTHWDIQITPTAEGPVNISLPASFTTGQSTSLNNEASNTLSYVSDVTAPHATISYLGANPTNASPLQIDLVFDENVETPTAADFQVTNGTVDNITGSGQVYSAEITPSSNLTTVGVQYGANQTTDLAGNSNTVSNSLSISFNSNRPLPTLSTVAGTHTNVAAITVDVSFSAAVTGFDVSDLTLTNATVSGFTGSGDTYSFTLTATAPGDFSVRVNNNAAVDASSNQSSTSNLLTVRYDATAPTITLSKTESSPTTLAAITITVAASETVTGLALTDFTTTNLTLSSLTGSGSSYTFTATANAEGSASIQLPAGVVVDAAANDNTVSNTLTWYYDTAAPSITIASVQAPSTNTSPIAVTFETNEGVTGFTSADVSVTNGTLSNFTNVDSTHWTADVTPTADGTVTVSVAASSFQDGAGKNNTAGSLNISYDGTRPTVTLTGLSAYSTTSPLTVTATFSESVTGFTDADLTLVNATASVSGSGTTYTLTVTPTAEGTFSVTVANGAASDSFGNTSTASNTHGSIYDITPPTATITSDVGVAAVESPIPLTVRFSEPVTGLIPTDFAITGGGSITSILGVGSVYFILYNPGSLGAKTLTLSVGSVEDYAGLANSSSASSSVIYYDTVPTTISISEKEQSIAENDSANKKFTITSTLSKGYDIHLKYSITGNAVTGVDHNLASIGSILLPAGATSVDVPFNIFPSASTENKYFQLNLNFADTPVARFSANYQSRVLIQDVDMSHPSILQMASNKKIRCAIYTGGILKCWGGNANNILGTGSPLLSLSVPTAVMTASTYKFVTVGNFHICAITSADALHCWGSQQFYRLGDEVNSGTFKTTPTEIDTGYSMVSAGADTSCGIKSGKVYCWGYNVVTGGYWISPTMIDVGGAFDFTTVAVTGGLTAGSICAINTNDDLYCFGDNTYGQAGNGVTGGAKIAFPLATPTASGYSKVQMNTTRSSEVHVCALNTSNKLFCWGVNSHGYAGDGTTTLRNTPTAVTGGDDYSDFVVSANHTCGIIASGRVKCWGANSNLSGSGEIGWNLGVGNASLSYETSTPTLISDTSTYASLSGGEDSTCGVLTDGRVKCWGEVDTLSIGDGTEYPRYVPATSDAGQTYKTLSLGGFGCGITTDDQLKCWGKNIFSGLAYSIGDDTTHFRPSPVMLDRGQTYSKISVGLNHACGITTDNALKCWGLNNNYQLGIGSGLPKTLPTIIDAETKYKEVSAGGSHTCAITLDDDLKCWGYNFHGQVGVNSPNSTINSPTIVTSGTKYSQVKTGLNHTCAINMTNDVFCWGDNGFGQLGDGTQVKKIIPTAVIGGGLKFQSIALNNYSTGASCGLLTNNKIYCWGGSFGGFTTFGSATSTPTEINGTQPFAKISGNGINMCAKRISNNLWYCWGYSSSGYVGTNGSNINGGESSPNRVVYGNESYEDIAVGHNSSCGILSNGTIKCWGQSMSMADHSVYRSWYSPIDVTNWLRP